jgi:hypothetical protein
LAGLRCKTLRQRQDKPHLASTLNAETTGDLLVLEATAALSYFKAWQVLPLSWEAKSVNPSDWLEAEHRQSKVSGDNRNARRSFPGFSVIGFIWWVSTWSAAGASMYRKFWMLKPEYFGRDEARKLRTPDPALPDRAEHKDE